MNGRFTRGNEKKYVMEVLQSGRLAPLGPMTRRYEKAFAEKMGVKHAFAVTSTQAAMQAGLSYAGVGPGDEVITDATAYFSAQAIMYANAVPVFADIDRDTFNIDPKSIRSRITSRTRAIICTHFFGLSCEMDEIMAVARDHGLVVIEDCAQATTATYKDRKVGSFGHIGGQCVQDSKQVSTGEGGMATTNDDHMAEEIRLMCQSGWMDGDRGIGRHGRGTRIGLGLLCTELQSAIGLAQLERIDEIIRPHQEGARKRIEFWQDRLGDKPFFVPQKVAPYQTHTYWHAAMKYVGDEYGVPFERFVEAAERKKWDLRFGYAGPVYLTGRIKGPGIYARGCPLRCPHYGGELEYERGLCPVLEDTHWRLISVSALGGPGSDKAEDICKTFWSLREEKAWSPGIGPSEGGAG